MRDELTFNAEDNDVAPDDPISLEMEWLNNNQLIIFNNKLNPSSNWVSDELTFNPSDIDVAPDSPILLEMKSDSITIN